MALLTSDIQNYLSSLSPVAEPKPVCVIDPATVTYFQPALDERLNYADTRFERQLDVICRQIEFATDEAVGTYLTPLEILEQMDEECDDELLADVLAQAIEATELTVAQPKTTFLQSIKNSLVCNNSWETFDLIKNKVSEPAYAEAITILLEDAFRVVEIAHDAHYEAEYMASYIIENSGKHLGQYWDFRSSESKEKLPDEIRPATIYRRWTKPLRFLASCGFRQAKELVADISLEQTLPLAELDSPDWVDAYTGEIDPDAEKSFVTIKARSEFPTSKSPVAEDLGWDEDTIQAFAAAQEGFSEGDAVEEIFTGEFGQEYKEPVFMAMQHDFQSTDRLFDLRAEIFPEVEDCRKRIEFIAKKKFAKEILQLVDKVETEIQSDRLKLNLSQEKLVKACQMVLTYPGNQDPALRSPAYKIYQHCMDFVDHFRKLTSYPEAKPFLDKLQDFIDRGESPVDVALIFLSLQHGYGFDENDAQNIHLKYAVDDCVDLYEFIEENKEEILENLSADRASRSEEQTEAEIDQFCEETLELLVAQGIPSAKDISKTPEYILGYFTAAFNGSTGDTASCIASGWEYWRQAKSPEGSLAYQAAIKAGAQPKDAMRAFWAVVNKAERREKEGRIVSINSAGLTLSSGRKVDWHIAKLKYKANELALSADDLVRLKGILVKNGWGRELVQAI
jgi:hypothetical protein